MKSFYLLLFSITCLTSVLNAQNYKRDWVSLTEDSIADYVNLNDMAVDVNGNTYMSGYEVFPGDEYYQTHLYLVKINAHGELEWKRSFNEQQDSIDEAFAVAVDTLGNVYVTGSRIDTFCNICTYSTKVSDIITMKYDAAGNRIWLNRYHDSNYILAAPTDITISPSGAICITGNERTYVSEIGTYVSNLLIQKIDQHGKTLWVRKKKDVVGNSACFDKQNNIVVAGASNPDNYYLLLKPMILKYNAAGNFLWSDVYDEPHKNGQFYFVQCDANNNIYLNGQTDTVAFYNHPKILTVKYNSAGVRKWFNKEQDFTHVLPHYYGDFKADAAGNCYVSGYLEVNDIDRNWLTTKYNAQGKLQWQSLYDGGFHSSDFPVSIAVDKNESVYVAGSVYGGGGNNSIASIFYNKQGDIIRSDIFKPAGKQGGIATGIGLDKNYNVYVGGTMSFKKNPNAFITAIKYRVIQTPVASNISSLKIVNELKLFPNPASSTLNIAFATSAFAKNYSVIIHDINGKAISSKQLNNMGKIINVSIDVRQLKPGIYTATISDGINMVSGKFIKE